MSRRSPYAVVLSDEDRNVLQARARAYTSSYAEVVRAKIVLLAADGLLNVEIAGRLDVHLDVASKWRQRFATEGLAGLVDRKRSGRPPVFGAQLVAEVKAMACEPPAQRQVPLSRWSSCELARQAVEQGCVQAVSASTVRRWLAKDALKPWRYRSWIITMAFTVISAARLPLHPTLTGRTSNDAAGFASCCGPSSRSPSQGFRHWASTRPVSRPSRQSATGPPGSYPDRTLTGKRRRARTR